MDHKRTVFRFSLVLTLTWATAGLANVRLPAVIGDNMVLQQGMKVPIWGWAEPGEKVSIFMGLDSRVHNTEANKDGEWMVKIGPFKAGGPSAMTVTGKNAMIVKNVMVGEVWVCSGQSNMQWALSRVMNAEQEISNANSPTIRLFKVPRKPSGQPASDVSAKWDVCTADTAKDFSAVAYFFGRQLHKEVDVPIGLIDSSWGGTRIEPWTPPAGFAMVPKLQEIQNQVEQAEGEYRKTIADSLDSIAAWVGAARKALGRGAPIPPEPDWPSHPLNSHRQPTGLYNGMIHPLVPFAIRGAIWYQGESNRDDGMMYFEKMKALITGWRKVWEQGNFPFYFVQLAPFRYGGDPLALPRIWEAQTTALSIPNTGMAVTTDIGNPGDIHPRNKQDVGKRLAFWALAQTYGRKDLVYCGPLYKSMAVEGGKVRIHFDHVGSGLASRGDKPLDWFTIAGPDRDFVRAEAKIDGETVLVWSEAVAEPAAVRFGWHQEAEPNLMNKEGLPAAPFRTDDWPAVTLEEK